MDRVTIAKLIEQSLDCHTKYHHNPEQPTLRDQFAMAALTGMAASNYWCENLDGSTKNSMGAAKAAYVMADQMLEARKQ